MKRCRFVMIAIVGVLFLWGCRTPIQEVNPHWKQGAQMMAAEKNSEASGLVWQPFPDFDNPLHQEIWNAYFKKRKIGSAYGTICNYYGVYLLTVTFNDMSTEPVSFFYDPGHHHVFEYNYNNGLALAFFKGNREATPSNAIVMAQHLAAANGSKSFVVTNANDIPHAAFSKDNPHLSFDEFLASKSIIITPPVLMRINGGDYYRGFDAYNVFVYSPCGGQLFRYEIGCRDGHLSGVRKFLIGEEIGDCWYIM